MQKKKTGRIWVNLILTGIFLGTCALSSLITKNDVGQAPDAFWRIQSPENALLRLHVSANSNLPADQLFKGKIVEQVQLLLGASDAFHPELNLASLGQQLPVLQEQLQLYADAAGAGGFDIAVTLREEAFPLRAYGRDIYPAGEYMALTVTVGEGLGENWWCLLFPPLCLPLVEVEEEPGPEAAPDEFVEADGPVLGGYDQPANRQNSGWRFKIFDQWNRWFKNN